MGRAKKQGGRQQDPAVTPGVRVSRARRAPRRYTPSLALNSTTRWDVSPVTTQNLLLTQSTPETSTHTASQHQPLSEVQQLRQEVSSLQQTLRVLVEGQRAGQQTGNTSTFPPTQHNSIRAGTQVEKHTTDKHTTTPTCTNEDVVQATVQPGEMSERTLPLHTILPQDLRGKIQDKEFVDFAAIAATFTGKRFPPQDGAKQRSETDKGYKSEWTTLAWARAALRFASSWLSYNPLDIQPLLTHMENVFQLAEDHGDWVAYDTQFRQQMLAAGYSFNQTRMVLYTKCMNRAPRQSSFRNYRNEQRDAWVPRGYCVAYHTPGKHCSSSACVYSHACHKCEGKHPRFLCSRQGKKGGEKGESGKTLYKSAQRQTTHS